MAQFSIFLSCTGGRLCYRLTKQVCSTKMPAMSLPSHNCTEVACNGLHCLGCKHFGLNVAVLHPMLCEDVLHEDKRCIDCMV